MKIPKCPPNTDQQHFHQSQPPTLLPVKTQPCTLFLSSFSIFHFLHLSVLSLRHSQLFWAGNESHMAIWLSSLLQIILSSSVYSEIWITFLWDQNIWNTSSIRLLTFEHHVLTQNILGHIRPKWSTCWVGPNSAKSLLLRARGNGTARQ